MCLPNISCGFKFRGALDLSTCSRFKKLPKNPWIIEGLQMLDLRKTVIKELPSSIKHLTSLTSLTLRYCMNLVHLPSTICSLRLLNSLDLFGCLKFDNLPENMGNIKGLEVLNLCWTAIKEAPSSIVLLKNLKQLNIHGSKSDFYSQPASLESMTPLQTSSIFLPTSPPRRSLLPSFLYFYLPTSPVPMGFLLPTLSGLQSLTYLYLRDCDLSSIPNDIGCLPSLECLNLSGNNFVSLPKSMSQLSNLQILCLEGCKRLQSLENVPSTIDFVIANDCISLERMPELQFYPLRSNHSHLNFQCLNCFKLVDYIQSGGNMFQGLSGRLPDLLEIIIPGREIPKWFNHECMGHKLNIQVPSSECDDVMEIALCAAFVPKKRLPRFSICQLSCSLNGVQMKHRVYFGFRTNYGIIESHHLWLLYYSNYTLNDGRISSEIDANGFCQLNIKIDSQSFEVKKIGVRLVYRQDTEDPYQTKALCINNSSMLL
ncbi:disease resistance-like protein DSC1 isoform X1 [Quercus lobata]|uniref:disease resistance-like protein DSC1 isoform X1 n=1 Tax=Quercus lobata TaxID=97700 RepID=UPI0012460C5B|nr:disease resistance-like protein DSC1 isoform X1 [Quercus lobata]XP_030926112.1 disease resistance-like protein DSC1 isoform X1 [Quercus lobata]XP_030926113.1 disease resistance-like protein DSC1 isoform X1 [Quercus lobata]XP_030926114.1 disease resistance-like protein DSC1 isoform X1 [Quercus lobata]XP_030926115.1 disease resistance-like protein DSC1 isoform X1 [Quercus lobata]